MKNSQNKKKLLTKGNKRNRTRVLLNAAMQYYTQVNRMTAQQEQQQQRKRKRKRHKLDPSQKVVVVGAGLAGLSVALSLQRAGFSNVQVYERDPSLEHQKEGYGLTLTYNPKGPLADLGVLETVASQECPSRSHYLFQQQPSNSNHHNNNNNNNNNDKNYAVPMGYFGNAFSEGRRGYGQRGNLRVPRKVLRKILHDALLAPNHNNTSNSENLRENDKDHHPTVYWNKSLVDFEWDASKQQYHVRFADTNAAQGSTPEITTTVTADLLVAADGIRSKVLQQLYNKNLASKCPLQTNTPVPSIRENPGRYGLRSMGIRLILGIAEGISHPLLQERGFYTVDTHGHRLFTMPYYSDRFDIVKEHQQSTSGNNKTKSKTKIMWQLSFSTPSNPETLDSKSLRNYVLDTFSTWHPPVLDLVKSTPPEGIWGTDLMDRNPRQVYQELIVRPQQSRLVVCGDALHSMSPFKGQGANQALADGPLLAKCLQKSSLDAALTNWWRETLNRTVPVVEASRQAAMDWHDPATILSTGVDYHGFAGVQPNAVPLLVKTLQANTIGPHLGGDLDRAIAVVISEHGWFEKGNEPSGKEEDESLDPSLCQAVLKLAMDGDTQGLRQRSLPSLNGHRRSCLAMVQARDKDHRSCLHLAALHKHYDVCKWLLTELCILEQWNRKNVTSEATNGNNCGPKDNFGKTALDYALESGQKPLIRLLEVVMRETQ